MSSGRKAARRRYRSTPKTWQTRAIRKDINGNAIQHTSKEQRDQIYTRDGQHCGYCGSTTGPFHIDHILPIWYGGASDDTNLVVACKRCNMNKGASTELSWMELLFKNGTPIPKRTARIYLARGHTFSFPHEPKPAFVTAKGDTPHT